MKILFFIFVLLILSNCANQATADKIGNDTPQPAPTVDKADVSDTNKWTPPPDEPVDNAKLGKLEKQNALFKVVPEEFGKVDFANLTYRSNRDKKIILLKNGTHEYEYKGDGCIACGGEKYRLGDVYFLDLTGDMKKEAVVFLSVLSCGGSCDGGADFIYIYSANGNKPKLIWRLETGSSAYGCSVKSLAIKSKKINIELFGRCVIKNDVEIDLLGSMPNKFNIEDGTRLQYEYNDGKIVLKHKEFIAVPERNVMNYLSEVSIIE